MSTGIIVIIIITHRKRICRYLSYETSILHKLLMYFIKGQSLSKWVFLIEISLTDQDFKITCTQRYTIEKQIYSNSCISRNNWKIVLNMQ